MTKKEMQIRLEMASQQMRRVLEARGLPFPRMDLLSAIHAVEDFAEACVDTDDAKMQAIGSNAQAHDNDTGATS